MKKELILGFMVLVISSKTIIAQNINPISKGLKNLYNNLNSVNGNLFFYKYGTKDTGYFSDQSMSECLKLIKLYSMKRVNVNFDSLSYYIPSSRIKDEISFGKISLQKPSFTKDELKYSSKLDSFFNNYSLRLRDTNQLPIDSFVTIENLLLTSSHTNSTKFKVSFAKKKLLKILAVYEDDKLLLIIYSIYLSLTESFISSELILK